MDSITHTLFGLSLYGATKKEEKTKEYKRALLFTTVVGSQIPDIDVISKLWDTEGLYQMWHRGITHSYIMAPIWALILYLASVWIWKTKDKKLFFIGLLSVFIHDTSDIFNAWGTGIFEPLSQARVTFGVIPIVNLVFWLIMLAGFFAVKKLKKPSHCVFKWVWGLMAFHVLLQSVVGYHLYQTVKQEYDQVALSADFVPFQFQAIGKNNGNVDIIQFNIWQKKSDVTTLSSDDQADLAPLFAQNPEAKTLVQWSPFVVVVNDEQRLGIYDPRFYRNGESFLYEYIEK